MSLPLFQELKAALASRTPLRRGPAPYTTTPASVLVPFYEEGGEAKLLFLKRPDGDYRHAGQIAFPGGKRDPGEDAVACALREAHEEVGLAPADVELLGELDDYDTVVSGFRITPIVGRIPAHYAFAPDPFEVERLIHVRLADLLDRGRFREEMREYFGKLWPVFFYSVGPDVIWGVTAGILTPLLDIVRALPSVRRL